MGRQASIRQKNGYWFSEAGGVGRYFGRVDMVSRAEAMARLWAALADSGGARGVGFVVADGENDLRTSEPTPPVGCKQTKVKKSSFARRMTKATPSPHTQTLSTITVHELAERFLAWVLAHRGEKAYKERSRHLRRFMERYGDLKAAAVTGSHIEAFTDALRCDGHAIDYVQKHLVSVGAMFNKGVRKEWIPPGVKPFASMEPLRCPPKTLTEDALPNDAEIRLLFVSAHNDPSGQMGDMLRLYHATGARTHELVAVRAGDSQRSTRQIVLGQHKRTHTLKEPRPRQVFLNETAFGIMERRCEGLDADTYISRADREPHSNVNIAERFQTVRRRAGVRFTITICSFRHLWISEMLMAGVDVLLVARMAGTSVAMIERVYGHFRNQSYQEAQARLDRERALRGL